MFFRKLMAGAALSAALLSGPAFAQQPTPEQIEMIYTMTRNQQGIFEYCQGKGMVNPEAVALQRRMVTLMPAPASTAAGDAAYARGQAGTMVAGPQTIVLAEAAKTQGVTEQALCSSMAEAVKKAAASLPPG
ncbi:pore-forming ESAT-6 family protein [Roseomonas haemaphysalidis]|jgi:hypothetical protein|uniref:Pore-forming ESAT-6 family protein n=1 Tax=Roseomonas haemaphysalidis TaxID=2768162 RepID=A0ABS3KXI6_9PROT|nr:pore-forming ESAT-6 family protein [Roseomonas haemaphysalidis]MBO1081051.1 pore-forming ESAT-6 family protein [Roseomonas haemaphysalidis]